MNSLLELSVDRNGSDFVSSVCINTKWSRRFERYVDLFVQLCD